MDIHRFVGVDVSKLRLVVFLRPDDEVLSFSNDELGIGELVQRLSALAPERGLLEATGGLEIPLVAALAEVGLPVVALNPRQIRSFAKAVGKLAKTDSIDARIIAQYAELICPTIRPIPDEQSRLLSDTVARRRQVVEMITAERKSWLQAKGGLQDQIHQHVVYLEQTLADLDHELGTQIRQNPNWHEKDQLLRTVPGVGPLPSSTLLANPPKLGALPNREVSLLVGVASINRDSGLMRGKRCISGSRVSVRNSLYMATLVACMRKLLTILNIMLRRNAPWSDDHSAYPPVPSSQPTTTPAG